MSLSATVRAIYLMAIINPDSKSKRDPYYDWSKRSEKLDTIINQNLKMFCDINYSSIFFDSLVWGSLQLFDNGGIKHVVSRYRETYRRPGLQTV